MVTSFRHPPTSRNAHDAIEFALASEFIGGTDTARIDGFVGKTSRQHGRLNWQD
jgi:hypothetical protein